MDIFGLKKLGNFFGPPIKEEHHTTLLQNCKTPFMIDTPEISGVVHQNF
jgi:hypothetical protein